MSNTVMSYIQVLDGGTLTDEDVNRAVYGEHPLPDDNGKPNYYSAHYVGNNSPWIKIRTKWGAPVGAIAQLAYARNLNVGHGIRFARQLRSRQHAVLPQACGFGGRRPEAR
jgi:hypothetical protein